MLVEVDDSRAVLTGVVGSEDQAEALREAVRQIRNLEESLEIRSSSGAKIIMTTALNDIKQVARCFEELCDAYLMKPINLAELLKHVKSYHLVQ